MNDYSEWLRRAENFVRSTHQLPGEWLLRVDIEPPCIADVVKQLENSLPNGLPVFLRDFYLTASARLECRYHWSPDAPTLALLEELIPHTYSFYGGVSICPAVELEGAQQGFMNWAEIFEKYGGRGPEWAAIIRQCVPLTAVGNGDYLGIRVDETDQPRVVYIDHETDPAKDCPIFPLANTPEEYFIAIEQLGYLGPESWMLTHFLDTNPPKLLDTQGAAAGAWRKMLSSFGLKLA